MLEQLEVAYIHSRWLKLIAGATLLVCAILFYTLFGGFPPWSWHLLFHVLPTLHHLWVLRGVTILLPLVGLLLLSASPLILWGLLVLVAVKMGQGWWMAFQERQQFALQMQEAQYMAEQLAASQVTIPDLVDNMEPAQEGETWRLVVGMESDPGRVRKDAPNEDSVLAVQDTHTGEAGSVPVGLFAVADGMGGHASGQTASRMAIEAISDTLVPILQNNTLVEEDCTELLQDGVHRANLAIYQRNRQQPQMMGTTITAALVFGMTAYVVNAGDSRTYLYRESEGLTPITRDHSTVAQFIENGIITREESYTHPRRNEIYRCLGEKATVKLDSFVVPLQVGDVLLLCSDGLWEMVRDTDIQEIIKCSSLCPTHLSSTLIQAALNRGGADNVSVVVVCVLTSMAASPAVS